jgi:ribosomal protein L24
MAELESIRISHITTDGYIRLDPHYWGLREQGFTLEELRDNIGNVGPADVSILVGVIAAGSGVLSAAITAIFAYLAKNQSGKILIEGKNGIKIEVPDDTSKEDIEYYIQKAREIEANKINIVETRPDSNLPELKKIEKTSMQRKSRRVTKRKKI